MTAYESWLKDENYFAISILILFFSYVLLSGLLMYLEVILIVFSGKRIEDRLQNLPISVNWFKLGALIYIGFITMGHFPLDFLIPKNLGSYDEYDYFKSTKDQVTSIFAVINVFFIVILLFSVYNYYDLKKSGKIIK